MRHRAFLVPTKGFDHPGRHRGLGAT
jgi:hypothetical protein